MLNVNSYFRRRHNSSAGSGRERSTAVGEFQTLQQAFNDQNKPLFANCLCRCGKFRPFRLSTNMQDESPQEFSVASRSPEQTEWLARQLAPKCTAVDTLLLSGEIGSGKTAFARAFIGFRLEKCGIADEIPSPTFTLVQTYNAGSTEIWHADLYRLNSPFEAVELGLDEAMDHTLCLIEWPERMGEIEPAFGHRLNFSFDASNEFVRTISIGTRNREIADFLASLDGEIPS